MTKLTVVSDEEAKQYEIEKISRGIMKELDADENTDVVIYEKADHKFCGKFDCSCTFAAHPYSKYWHPTKNKEIKPGHVGVGTCKKYWITCRFCGHDVQQSVQNIVKGNKCGICQVWTHCGDFYCDYCFDHSYASHETSLCWNYDLNHNITPLHISITSRDSYWLTCYNCGHCFKKHIFSIFNSDSWCPYCVGGLWNHCRDDDCKWCLNKSFASHPKHIYWHKSKNEPYEPLYVSISSGYEYYFTCPDCRHDFRLRLNSISSSNEWCSYCSQNWKHCGNLDCAHCLSRSFKSSTKSDQIHPTMNGLLNPLFIAKHSKQMIWFICETCDEIYKTCPDNIKLDKYCRNCKHKTQKTMCEYMRTLQYVKVVEAEVTFEWCKSVECNRCLRFDSQINENPLVECDGRQHFKQVRNWKDPIFSQERDLYKMKKALENGKSVIRIFQEDIYNNKANWKLQLSEAIEKTLSSDKPMLICIPSTQQYVNDVYKIYEKKWNEYVKELPNKTT